MGIKFSADDWARTKENYTKWWNKELDRPLVPIVLEGRDPGRPQPAVPILTQATCTDLSIPAETLIDRLDYELSRYEYLGDSFPYINMDVFGPGVMNAFLGAELRNETGYVWFW